MAYQWGREPYGQGDDLAYMDFVEWLIDTDRWIDRLESDRGTKDNGDDSDDDEESQKRPLLHAACQYGHEKVAAMLVDKEIINLVLDLRHQRGATPLSLAVKGGWSAIVKMLIEA